MVEGDVVKLEVPGEEPRYGHIIKVDSAYRGKHTLVCFHEPGEAKAEFELKMRELVPA